MKNSTYSIQYPRRVLIRKGMTSVVRLLLALLTRVEINGRQYLPEKGPLILAGNHVAVLEAVMMAAYTPGVVEFFGTGDIPLDPNYAFIVKAYDLIPVNRGNIDRQGLKMGLDVLEQGGILGIFPEGGTWDPAQMPAQTGVAWLSYRGKAPVLPIGFGGIKSGLQKALKFKRPKLVMNVGEVIPPVTLTDSALSIKSNLQIAANQILAEINALIPEEDLHHFRRRIDEVYQLEIKLHSHDGALALPEDYQVHHGDAYARFLYNPTLMDVLVRNLHLPIKPLKGIKRQANLIPVLNAWQSILDYLKINPGYFTYRFGIEGGLAVKYALEELIRLGEWVHQSGASLTITPIRHFRNTNTDAQVTERGGCFPKSL
jgi:1-acyl-sn-glycerol-3-phosphate acyltransferase